MNGKTPHIVQYQGSKRLLAPQILQYMPNSFNRLIEPFAGMAAISIATAKEKRARKYYINDINEPLINLLRAAINTPDDLLEKYARLWREQFEYPPGHVEHFYGIRESFNRGEQTPEKMLYLLARCVKGAVRYGKNGNFNQSPDKRRHGASPQNIQKSLMAVSALLKGKVTFSSTDYRHLFDIAEPGDLLYLDPPYQGVSNTRDNRYFAGLGFDEFSDSIELLNRKDVDYIISYDGECGEKEYGLELPPSLNCAKFLLKAGLSAQATLLGQRNTTYEALYVSKNLAGLIKPVSKQTTFMECAA